MRWPTFLVKRSDGADNLLLFLIFAAASILITRLFLYFLDYPQIARGQIHLAHALFGGLFLSLSSILLFSFHGKKLRQLSSILAGVGFGQFIDEVGKLITQDNNYFYKPAVVVIYFSFILLFFAYRYLNRHILSTPPELIYDVLQQLEGLSNETFDAQKKQKTLKILARLQKIGDPEQVQFAKTLTATLKELPHDMLSANHYLNKAKQFWTGFIKIGTENNVVFGTLVIIFSVYVVLVFKQIFVFGETFFLAGTSFRENLSWSVLLLSTQILSQICSAVLMIKGFTAVARRNKIVALSCFKTALIIDLLITQFFVFYFRQFGGSISLLITLVLFIIVHNLLENERPN